MRECDEGQWFRTVFPVVSVLDVGEAVILFAARCARFGALLFPPSSELDTTRGYHCPIHGRATVGEADT